MSIPPLSPSDRPNPDSDGIDHINVYSKAKTQLGRNLSNFAHLPFNHPKHGFFASMEAYWYWVKTGMKHNNLRRLYGLSAKTAGIREDIVKIDSALFMDLICDGLRLKILQNTSLRDALKNSNLPLRHYYVYGTNPSVVREKKDDQWQMTCLEEIRQKLKSGTVITLSDGSSLTDQTIRELPEDPVPDDMERYVD